MSSLRRSRTSRVARVLVTALFVAVATVTAAIVRGEPEDALAGGSAASLAAELAVGAALVSAGIALGSRRPGRFPALLVATGLAWPLTEWNSPGAGGSFSAGLVLSAAWPVLLAAAVLIGPDERPLGRAAVGLLIIAGVTNVGVLGLAQAAVFDPPAQSCFRCPANRLLVGGDANAWRDLGQAGLALGAAWAAALTAFASFRLGRSSPALRRLTAPVVLPSVTAVALFGAGAIRGVDRGFLPNDPAGHVLWTAQAATLALVAAGVAWQGVRARRTRAALAQLVVELGASPSPGRLGERLAVTLGDPSLALLYAREDGTWIDAEGRAAVPATGGGRETTPIVAAGQEIAAVVHRRGLLDDTALAGEIAATARLGIEHDRLHATRRAHLAELRASRARIVAAADAERRRLERDLHDGAQQRLVTIALGVRLARRRLAAGDSALDAELAHAERELNAAVGELRELAHGLFPAVLGDEGLAAALEALAEQAPRLVPGALPEERFTTPVESAAYYVVAETLRLAPTGDLAVDARLRDSRLLLDVRTEIELAGAPTRLEDRVGAVGGTLEAKPHELHAELPCAS